jgi:hypothetical protein
VTGRTKPIVPQYHILGERIATVSVSLSLSAPRGWGIITSIPLPLLFILYSNMYAFRYKATVNLLHAIKWTAYTVFSESSTARDIRPASETIHTKGAQIWTLQNVNKAERRENFVLKQMYFSVNNDNAVAWKYIDLRPSAVRRFQKVNNCLK